MLNVLRFFLGACLVAILFATHPARAQETWAAAAPPTTQTLWGIAYNPSASLFVTVGEGGTILTSPDGLVWTSRVSGTAQWLLAVAYSAALQRYVVVGDQGLVLTSTDAVTWTPRLSGTPQRLNGVAANPSPTASVRFLAVGEAGTVLASADGLTWTSSTIAKAGWLRGVTFGGGRFVISGQGSTNPPTMGDYAALFTTTDGTAFQSETSGLPLNIDLEALAFDGGQFAVAGRSVVALSPSGAPLSWKTRLIEASGLSTPPFRWFRGVTFFNNTWVSVGALTSQSVGGSNRPIVYAQANSIAQNAAGVDPTASLNAVAASPTVAVAVGMGGAVWRSTATQAPPTPFLLASTSTVVAATDTTVSLAADARGSAPLTFQWSFNGQPIMGATASTLVLSAVSAAQSGSYTLTATNPLGTATSTPYFLTVVSPVAVAAPVDPTFLSPLTAEPGTIAVQPDGKPLIATQVAGGATSLSRLNLDGSFDASFQPPPDLTGGFELLADGRILVTRTTPQGVRTARLNVDGSLDPTFSASLPAGIRRFLPDGRLIVMRIENNALLFARFNADGSPDADFTPPPFTLGPAQRGGFDPQYFNLFAATTASGQIVVVAVSQEAVGTGIFGRNESKLLRLLTDGTVDASFATVTLPVSIDQFVLAGEKFYYRSWSASFMGSVRSYIFGRLNADGSNDPAYPRLQFGGSVSRFPLLQLGPDGSVYRAEPNTQVIQHYDANGILDQEFSALFASPVTFTRLMALTDGRLLVTGQFTQLNGVITPYLARLIPDRRSSATRLTNISVRQLAGTGSQTLIAGFVITGQGDKRLLLRGVGPTLVNYSVPNPLADPKLSLYDATGALRFENDNWSDRSDSAQTASAAGAVGAFALPAGSKDAAFLASLAAGAYTAQVRAEGATGVALLEGYDTGDTPADRLAPRVVNFSARANSGLTENALIAGFTISGPNAKTVLLRGIGPGLTQFGVTDVLADPQLTVYHNGTAIAANDNWGDNSGLAATFTTVGAFPLSSTLTKDAALVLRLPPGSYTAQVTGVNNTTGVALVEVYEVP